MPINKDTISTMRSFLDFLEAQQLKEDSINQEANQQVVIEETVENKEVIQDEKELKY